MVRETGISFIHRHEHAQRLLNEIFRSVVVAELTGEIGLHFDDIMEVAVLQATNS